jgi:hypothetical protein
MAISVEDAECLYRQQLYAVCEAAFLLNAKAVAA